MDKCFVSFLHQSQGYSGSDTHKTVCSYFSLTYITYAPLPQEIQNFAFTQQEEYLLNSVSLVAMCAMGQTLFAVIPLLG